MTERLKRTGVAFAVLAAVVLAGCGGSVNESLWGQIKTLGSEKTDLQLKAEQLTKENQQLRQQILTLQAVDPNQRDLALASVDKIVLNSLTGLYDKDGNGTRETLAVYVEPVDATQDRVKAPGRMEVELWHLDAKDPKMARLAQWTVEPGDLKKQWGKTVMSAFYRVSFPVGDILKGGETGLDVKVKFTDYFTGKVLEAQRTIE